MAESFDLCGLSYCCSNGCQSCNKSRLFRLGNSFGCFCYCYSSIFVKEGRIQLEHMREGTSLYDDDPEGLFEGPSVSALGTPGSITVEVAHDEKRRTRKFKNDNLMLDQKLYQ